MRLKVRPAEKKDGETLYKLNVLFQEEWFKKYKKSKLKEFADIQKIIILKGKKYKKKIRKFENWCADILKLKDDMVFVLEDTNTKNVVGQITGYIKHQKEVKVKDKGYLDSLYIIKEYRRKGGGHKLVKYLMKWFKESGIKYVDLDVDLINPKAVKFYSDCGFKKQMYKMIKKIK